MKNDIYSPSLMGLDLLSLKEDVITLDSYFKNFHFDIMDGNYCKNFALTPGMLKAIRPFTSSYIDAHVMARKPDEFIIDSLLDAGANCISLHPETIWESQYRTVNKIHDKGADVGLVLNPSLSVESVEHILGRVDILTIMTVDIGFSGQKFIPEMMEKIEKANKIRKEKNYKYKIQIDGHCTKDLYQELLKKGADLIIIGRAGLFSLDPNLKKACVLFEEGLK